KLGPIGQLMDMLPGGMGQMARTISPKDAEQQLKRTEAILSSMTPMERRKPDVLNASRKRRIARGSGTQVQEINMLLKQYRETQKLFKMFKKVGPRGMPRIFG
ncbi:MAG: signal recognition particle protein, partial [Anaerolineales bacterium]|nr:signal recognition particle protein [Anaerolineales bacterium]